MSSTITQIERVKGSLVSEETLKKTWMKDLLFPDADVIKDTGVEPNEQKKLKPLEISEELLRLISFVRQKRRQHLEFESNFQLMHVLSGLRDYLPKDAKPSIGINADLQKEYETLYDPKEPTLAIVAGAHIPGARLMGLAAARMREAGERAPNIIYISYLDLSNMEVSIDASGKSRVYVGAGAIVNAEGKYFTGILPQTEVHLIDFLSLGEIRDRADELKFPLTVTTEALQASSSKIESKKLFKKLGVKSPDYRVTEYIEVPEEERRKAIIRPKFVNGKLQVETEVIEGKKPEVDVYEGIEEFLDSDVVIKPDKGSHGNNVQLIADPKLNDVRRRVKSLQDKTKGPVLIERWIKNADLEFADRKLDFNVRMVATPESVIGYEARVGDFGDPININNEKSPAKPYELVSVLKVVNKIREGKGKEPFDIEAKIKEMGEISVHLAREVGTGVIGVDFMIDNNGEIWLIEINCGQVGLMTSLEKIRKTEEGKLNSPTRLVRNLHQRMLSMDLSKADEDLLISKESFQQWPPRSALEVFNYIKDLTGNLSLNSPSEFKARAVYPGVKFVLNNLEEIGNKSPFIISFLVGAVETFRMAGWDKQVQEIKDTICADNAATNETTFLDKAYKLIVSTEKLALARRDMNHKQHLLFDKI